MLLLSGAPLIALEGLIFTTALLWAIRCGLLLGRNLRGPEASTKSDHAILLSWLLLLWSFIPGIGILMFRQYWQQTAWSHAFEQRQDFARRLRDRYSRITDIQTRLNRDGKTLQVDITFSGTHAGPYFLDGHARDCAQHEAKWEGVVSLPASDKQVSFTLLGEWRYGEWSEGGPAFRAAQWNQVSTLWMTVRPTLTHEDDLTLHSFPTRWYEPYTQSAQRPVELHCSRAAGAPQAPIAPNPVEPAIRKPNAR